MRAAMACTKKKESMHKRSEAMACTKAVMAAALTL
jgi:hypothetical protein